MTLMATTSRTPVFWSSPFGAKDLAHQQEQQQAHEAQQLQPALEKFESWALFSTESEVRERLARLRGLGGSVDERGGGRGSARGNPAYRRT